MSAAVESRVVGIVTSWWPNGTQTTTFSGQDANEVHIEATRAWRALDPWLRDPTPPRVSQRAEDRLYVATVTRWSAE